MTQKALVPLVIVGGLISLSIYYHAWITDKAVLTFKPILRLSVPVIWSVNHTDPSRINAANSSAESNIHSQVIGKAPGEFLSNLSTRAHGVCGNAFRKQRLRYMCEKSPPPPVNSYIPPAHNKFKGKKGLAVAGVLFDPERKVWGCTISKVSSSSWIQFMALSHLKKGTVLKPKEGYNRLNLTKYGMNFTMGVPVQTLNGPEYRNWKKYMIVRHPLRRMISGFHEGIEKRRHFKATFSEFMEKLGNGEFHDADEHWSRYHSWCHPCDIEYDYILKVETMKDDLSFFIREMGIPENHKMNKLNPNKMVEKDFKMQREAKGKKKQQKIIHKYDKMLLNFMREQPETFQKVMNVYQYDMDSFGYKWKPNDTYSICSYDDGIEGDCC